MALSKVHEKHCQLLKRWAESKILDDSNIVLIDSIEAAPNERPSKIFGHVPDLVVLNGYNEYQLIGDAKTERDIKNDHTRSQITSFAKVISYQGNGILLFSVPHYRVFDMRQVILDTLNTAQLHDIEWYVISEVDFL